MSDLTDKKRLSACIQMLRDGCLINAADQRFVADVIAALAALRPAQDAEGWVMVPRILTQPMLDAYMHAFVSAKRFDPQEVWSAMIAASPPRTLEGK